ncbi:Fic family protein [Mucilaginibacter flavidus]|uniref:Fic family protein n=1 Tax=Mucilaginibacter flavidus TaxID=2949309 RepID=UPI002092A04F|nr:Fic family protein [Mucilaginibacter flavidus]MCO5945790.1 Fic family protein [Mucilaginibacter flavidus]
MNKVNVHTETLDLNWQLINLISEIDRFDASWQAIERREGQSLKELKSIATVRSVGASTRIEGSKLSDEEVNVLLKNIDITKLEERDQQEVVGYFEVLDLIDENYEAISVSGNDLKNIHNQLLKYSTKDAWHKGNYKQHTNAVEAHLPDGTTQIIFQTTPPGFPTEDAMREMVSWYAADLDTHALVKSALFCYEFVSIHPFQDGNGRLSRLLATLLLRKNGYQWIRYVSFEHEIESRKTEYYRVLRACQSQRPGEDITEWIVFFLSCIGNIQKSLMQKLDAYGVAQRISVREKQLLYIIESNPGIKTSEIANKLGVSNSTIKRMLDSLITAKLIERQGVGPGSYYTLL